MNEWTRRMELARASAEPGESRRAPPSHHYFAFLSYSHDDSADADWLHQELEKFRVPRSLAGKLTANGVIPKRLSPIFRDRHEFAAGRDLTQEIRVALAASRCLIVLCSPASTKSKWTNTEIEVFKKAHPDGCIIAAIVAGDPLAKDDQACFPPALLQKYDRLGRPTGKRAEPLAADLRDSGDGRRMGLLKIVAGILGVGLDDLVQRDHLRRQRRLALITAASLAGMVVTSGLAVTAIQARDAARDQRRQAESLIGFMLGDLKDKLEPIGRLDVLDGVGSRVLAYYKNQDTSELSDQGLAQRSSALTLMGRIAQARGNLNAAENFIRAALAGTAESVRRDPEDPQRIFDHAQNVFWLGELARSRGQRAEADAAYREYKRLADRMVAIDPNNLKWKTEEMYGDENLGIVEYSHRDFDSAARDFAGALQLMKALASLDANVDRQKDLATGLAWAADTERSRGGLNSAIALRRSQISTLNGLLTASPDANTRAKLVTAHQGLGILLTERGGSDDALEELKSAASQADALTAIEPRNAAWRGLAASAHLELARTLVALGRATDAKAEAATGCSLVTGLPSGDAASSKTRMSGICSMINSRIALAAGATDQALQLAQAALASARQEHSDDPVTDRYDAAAMYRLLGDVYQRKGDTRAASIAWNSGLAQLVPNVAERPWEMNERAELLRRLGRNSELRPLQQRLNQIGYRRGV